MARKDYTGKDIVVSFDLQRCIHSTVCLRALPGVFIPGERPWIRADEASADELAAAVSRCPSGALQFRRLDGGAPEQLPAVPQVVAFKDGPLLVRGNLELKGEPPIPLAPRAALCRCGHSANKPFCDNAHRRVGFKSG